MTNELERPRCPKCKVESDTVLPAHQCDCGHVWNTFSTRAKCPSCNKQWVDTQCPDCGEWSLHVDWWKA